MLELKLPQNGTMPYPYTCEDFQYELLLNLEGIGLYGSDADRIRFSMNLINPKYPHPLDDAMVYVLQRSILAEEGYRNIEKREYSSNYEKDMKKSGFVEIHTMKPLVDLVAGSIKEESGRLLLSGSENIANSYYDHRYIYVLPAISGVGVMDVRAGTSSGRFVRVFCSNEIDTSRRENIRKRILNQFVKCPL